MALRDVHVKFELPPYEGVAILWGKCNNYRLKLCCVSTLCELQHLQLRRCVKVNHHQTISTPFLWSVLHASRWCDHIKFEGCLYCHCS